MELKKEPLPAIYSRKSKFTGKGESIENQIGLCREYIRVHFGAQESNTCLVYEDEGFSGGTLERPQFKRMMEDAEAGLVKAVVVYRLDRISRNIGDFAGLIERFNSLNISFISIKEQFDTRSPMGRAMMYIASVFSQLERETIAERIRDNMRELAKTGRWLGGTTPFGYCSEGVTEAASEGRYKKTFRLKLVPAEAAAVRQIFGIFLSTASLKETESFLMNENIKTRQEKFFGRFAIRGILSNPVYMAADEAAYVFFKEKGSLIAQPPPCFDGKNGVMVYNRTLQQKGKTNQQRGIEEWIVAVGSHEHLVSGSDWLKARAFLEKNQRQGGRKKTGENPALLGNVIYCASCGSPMRAKLSGKPRDTSNRSFSYLCIGKEKSRGCRCSVKNAGGVALDREILKLLEALSEDQGVFITQLGMLLGNEAKENKEAITPEQLLLRQEETCEKEMRNLLRVLAETGGGTSAGYLAEEIDKLHEKKEAVKRKRLLLSERGERRFTAAAVEKTIAQIGSFGGALQQARLSDKRNIVQALVEKVIWDGEKAQVYFFDVNDTIDNKLPFGYTVEHK